MENTQCPWPGFEPRQRDREISALSNHKATASSHKVQKPLGMDLIYVCLYFPITIVENMAQADNPTDIVVVPGCRTNEDGSPSEMMKSRVKRAAELYTSLKQQNIDCRVIVTGYQAPDQVIDSCPNVPITFSINFLSFLYGIACKQTPGGASAERSFFASYLWYH